MKTYATISELAKDHGISVRTAWRWLEKGRVRRTEGGFKLCHDSDTDTDSDTPPDIQVSRDTRHSVSYVGRHKNRYDTPFALPVSDPSMELKKVREKTEEAILEAERVRALKEIEKLTQKPPLSLEEKRALLEETKIDLELRRLKSEELSEERKKKASEIVERIKLSVLPKPFRDELPAVVVYRILLKITEELSKVDPLSTPEDELTAIAKLARDSVLSEVRPSELSPAVVRAFSRAIFDYLHAVHRASAPQMDFDSFLGNLFLDLLKKDQDAFIELITNLTAFVNSIGDDESRNRFNTKVQSLIGILGQGGDANGKGLPV
ncbi:MAG: hypothetical protein QXT73_06920 [Candidatus Methanomethylicaceae archaeon]